MSNEVTIERILNANHTDENGMTCQRIRQLKLYYMKGRGIVLSITTLDRRDGSNSHMLFSEGNTSVAIERLTRPKPTLLKQLGEAMTASQEAIFDVMVDYDDDSKWSDADRGELIRTQIIPRIKGFVAA